jgi:hypothetical protein
MSEGHYRELTSTCSPDTPSAFGLEEGKFFQHLLQYWYEFSMFSKGYSHYDSCRRQIGFVTPYATFTDSYTCRCAAYQCWVSRLRERRFSEKYQLVDLVERASQENNSNNKLCLSWREEMRKMMTFSICKWKLVKWVSRNVCNENFLRNCKSWEK